jgi:hypothetical protein
MGNCIGRTLNLKFRRERGKDIFVPRGEPPCGVAPYGTAFADMPNLRTEGFEEICEYEVRRPGSLFHVIYYFYSASLIGIGLLAIMSTSCKN